MSDSVSIEECIREFSRAEELDASKCDLCRCSHARIKTLEFWRLPNVLMIQLKRFDNVFSHPLFGTSAAKVSCAVYFPLHNLQLVELSSQSTVKYELFASINHFGASFFGHYTATVRRGDSWYHVDDEKVSSINESDVCSSSSYILFYRRVGTPSMFNA